MSMREQAYTEYNGSSRSWSMSQQESQSLCPRSTEKSPSIGTITTGLPAQGLIEVTYKYTQGLPMEDKRAE